jgi:hypothetical protein
MTENIKNSIQNFIDNSQDLIEKFEIKNNNNETSLEFIVSTMNNIYNFIIKFSINNKEEEEKEEEYDIFIELLNNDKSEKKNMKKKFYNIIDCLKEILEPYFKERQDNINEVIYKIKKNINY